VITLQSSLNRNLLLWCVTCLRLLCDLRHDCQLLLFPFFQLNRTHARCLGGGLLWWSCSRLGRSCVFTGRMPVLSPDQQCQSIEGSSKPWRQRGKMTHITILYWSSNWLPRKQTPLPLRRCTQLLPAYLSQCHAGRDGKIATFLNTTESCAGRMSEPESAPSLE